MKRARAMIAFAGCTTLLPAPGRTMMQAPADVPFCDGTPTRVVDREGTHNFDMPGVEECSTLFRYYPALHGAAAWSGAIDFVLTVDADRRVVDVCVKGGNFGNVPEYVSCLAAKARQRKGLPAGRVPWRLRYIYD